MVRQESSPKKAMRSKSSSSNRAPDLDFMDTLWEAANRLRGKMEASQYKHIVLPLIFLKYISDMFEFRRRWLQNAVKDSNNEYYILNMSEEEAKSILEDRDEYLSIGVFYVPPKARWTFLMNNAMQANIGKLIDEAMTAIETENPKQLRGVLPKIYTQAQVPPHVLGELINLFSKVEFTLDEDKEKDILGRVYEYFIGKFAQEEGRKGGQFYTPGCVVKLLVGMLEPFEGRVYDPACGSGGMFVQSWKFLEANRKDPHAISIYGQELMETTWHICKMNLALRGIPSENIALEDTLLNNQFPNLRADFIITNPPFNMTKWGAGRIAEDVRWKYGIPDDTSKNGGNYAWIQHYIYHISPNGRAGFVMANGSLSCGKTYGKIRKGIVEDDLVDCIIALPPKLFLTTGIPVCLWFLSKNKNEKAKGQRDRSGEVLFIDARDTVEPVSRRLNVITDDQIQLIVNTYRAWRKGKRYKDVLGFCKSVTLEEVRKYRHILTPGRYVGIPVAEEKDSEPFKARMERLDRQLKEQFAKGDELKERIGRNLEGLWYELK